VDIKIHPKIDFQTNGRQRVLKAGMYLASLGCVIESRTIPLITTSSKLDKSVKASVYQENLP
jgi:hypothetical protein